MKLFLQDELILPNCLFYLLKNAKTRGECGKNNMWTLQMPHLNPVHATCTDCIAYMYTSYKLHVLAVHAACTRLIRYICLFP